MLNTWALNTKPINGAATASVLEAEHQFLTYRLEVRSISAGLLAYLPLYSDIVWDRQVNTVETLEFTYPGDDENAAYFVWPNELHLRDERNRLLQRFTIQRQIPGRDLTRLTNQVYAESTLSMLGDEYLVDYSIEDATVKDIIKDLFDNRIVNSSYTVRFGSIDPAIGTLVTSLKVSVGTVKDAIDQLYASVGLGYYYVDPSNRAFHWKMRIGERKGQQLHFRKNMSGVQRVVDYKDMANRIYLYGEGSTKDTRLKLTDAGEPHEYIQDTSYSSRIRSRVLVMKNVSDPLVLLSTAEAILAVTKQPYIGYTVQALDLSMSKEPGHDYRWERLQLGSTVKVIDDPLNITTSEIVVRLVSRLNNPADINVELAQKSRDISHLLEGVLDRLDALENADYGAPLGDAVPQPVGVGSPGTSAYAARNDHSHELDPEALEDALGTVPIQDAIEAIVTPMLPEAGTGIQAVAQANSDGGSADFASVNHIHKGNSFTAADFASLPAEAVGSIAVTTGTNKYGYARLTTSLWQRFTHI